MKTVMRHGREGKGGGFFCSPSAGKGNGVAPIKGERGGTPYVFGKGGGGGIKTREFIGRGRRNRYPERGKKGFTLCAEEKGGGPGIGIRSGWREERPVLGEKGKGRRKRP